MSSFSKYLEQSLNALEDDMADIDAFEPVVVAPAAANKKSSLSSLSSSSSTAHRQKDVANLNQQLLALGCRPLFETATLSDELLTCVGELILVAKHAQQQQQQLGAGLGEGGEAELRALRLDKKSLSASVKQLTAQLEAERVTSKNREKSAATTLERLAGERDEAVRQNALLKSREEQWTRELKRRDLETAQLRERLRKLLDGVAASSESTTSHADIVGDVRHTPMKQRAADQLLTGASVALQRQLAEAQVEVMALKGERSALREELRDLRLNK